MSTMRGLTTFDMVKAKGTPERWDGQQKTLSDPSAQAVLSESPPSNDIHLSNNAHELNDNLTLPPTLTPQMGASYSPDPVSSTSLSRSIDNFHGNQKLECQDDQQIQHLMLPGTPLLTAKIEAGTSTPRSHSNDHTGLAEVNSPVIATVPVSMSSNMANVIPGADNQRLSSFEEHFLRHLWEGSAAGAMAAAMLAGGSGSVPVSPATAAAANNTLVQQLQTNSPSVTASSMHQQQLPGHIPSAHSHLHGHPHSLDMSMTEEMMKKRRGRPPGSKNRPKPPSSDEGSRDYVHVNRDDEPPNKKRRGRPPGSKNRFPIPSRPLSSENMHYVSSQYGVQHPPPDELVRSLQKELQDSEQNEEGFEVVTPTVSPMRLPPQTDSKQNLGLPKELPKPGSVGVSRFSERVVASLSRYLGTKGGDLRLGCDEHGMEVFIVRCQYCARDVRLSGRRTWNFTGVHIPRCIKHGFRKADDISSTPAPPGRPPTVSGSSSASSSGHGHKAPLSNSNDNNSHGHGHGHGHNHGHHHAHAYGHQHSSSSASTSASTSSAGVSVTAVNDVAARAAAAAVAAAAAAAGVFPGLPPGVAPTGPQAAAAAAALLNAHHQTSGTPAHHPMVSGPAAMFLQHPGANMGTNMISNPLGMPTALATVCLPNVSISSADSHMMMTSTHDQLVSNMSSPVVSMAPHMMNESLAMAGLAPMTMTMDMKDSLIAMHHAQFNVMPTAAHEMKIEAGGIVGSGDGHSLHDSMSCSNDGISEWRRVHKSPTDNGVQHIAPEMGAADALVEQMDGVTKTEPESSIKVSMWNQ